MKKINKKNICAFVRSLVRDSLVVAPVDIDGVRSFRPVSSLGGIDSSFGNSRKSSKEIVFPQWETMFSYGHGKLHSTDKVDRRIVLLGVRPCDARANLILDNVFLKGQYQDVYYRSKRKSTVVVGLGCENPLSTCFCTSFGGGPFSTLGLDMLLTDIGEAYVADIIQDRGKNVLTPEFEDASREDIELAENIKTRAEKRMKSEVPLDDLKERLDGMTEDPLWEKLSEKCIGCAVCTYLCPTCHCFDITEEGTESEGRRARNWDSCMFPLFTSQASGYNPRPTGTERMRQRIMHKFNYFPENYNEPACVGCGRCIINCPVNVDIRRVLKEIAER